MTRAAPHQPHCPYCLSAILPSEDSVVCSACGIPHHRECWRANRRCTTYGCTGRAQRIAPESAPRAWRPAARLDVPAAALPADVEPVPPADQPSKPAAEQPGEDDVLEVYIPPRGGSLSPVWIVILIVVLPLLMALALSYAPPDRPDPPPGPQTVQGRPWQRPAPPPPSPAAPASSGQPGPTARLVTAHAYLRASPDDDSMIVNRLYPGAVVDVLDSKGQWAYVRTPVGDEGYVHRDALAPIRTPTPPARNPKSRG